MVRHTCFIPFCLLSFFLSRVLQVSRLKATDGLIAHKYPEHKVFVTSPNMDCLTEPLLGEQTVRLKKQLHYGVHDPLLFAQPFSSRTPHLCLIRYPGGTHFDTTIFWDIPPEDKSELANGHQLLTVPLGLIAKDYTTLLDEQFRLLQVSASVISSASEPKVHEYIKRMRYLLARLASPATYPEALMVFRIAV